MLTVRQGGENQRTTGFMKNASNGIRRLRAEELKRRGDEAVKQGNYKEGYRFYSECLAIKPDKHGVAQILANRSLAYAKAGQNEKALADADEVLRLLPSWDKAHFRRGSALMGLLRYAAAVGPLRRAWGGPGGDCEAEKLLARAVGLMTREEIAEGLVGMFEEMVEQRKLEPPELQTVTPAEMVEGMFLVIKEAGRRQPKPNPYTPLYLRWIREGIKPEEAYVERSRMYCMAKCFKQAKLDAGRAIRLAPRWHEAYGARAKAAHTPPQDDEDHSWFEAVRAYGRAVELAPEVEEYQEYLQMGGKELSNEQMNSVLDEIYNGEFRADAHPLSLGVLEKADEGLVLRCDVRLHYPQADGLKAFDAHARDALRMRLASLGGVPKIKVLIMSVKAGPPLQVDVQVLCGADRRRAEELLHRLKTDPKEALSTIPEVLEKVGPLDLASFESALLDMTEVVRTEEAKVRADLECMAGPVPDGARDRRLLKPERPRLEIALPYKGYRLCRIDGRKVERVDKHPFQLSRAYYDNSELPDEVYAEPVDHSLRWRQSASAIRILVLTVPAGLRPSQLDVSFDTRTIRVTNKTTKEMYLEGTFERAIIPDECVWEYGGGTVEDGLIVTVEKMNLELFQDSKEHSHMWWPRLFTDHAEIAWDDYEKDYSDLPPAIMHEYQAHDKQQSQHDRLTFWDGKQKEWKVEQDEVRKRDREARLRKLGIMKVLAEPKKDPMEA